jgi:hypothetical protein
VKIAAPLKPLILTRVIIATETLRSTSELKGGAPSSFPLFSREKNIIFFKSWFFVVVHPPNDFPHTNFNLYTYI